MRGWTPEEDAMLVNLYQSGYRVEDIARHLGRTVRSVYIRAGRLGVGRFRSLGEPPNTRIHTPLNLSGDFAITSDWHIPYYDQGLADEFLLLCQKKHIRKLIIAGDFVDFSSVSFFPGEYYDLNEELQQAEKAIKILSGFFREIYVIPGNHDFRLARKLDVPLSYQYVLRMFCDASNVFPTEFDHIDFVSGGRRWKVCHPKNYSQIKCRVAYQLAGRYECNIVSAHGHFCGVVKSASGKYFCVDSGGMFDKRRIAYFHRTSTYPDWNQGFVFVIDGFPEVYTVDDETGKVVRI